MKNVRQVGKVIAALAVGSMLLAACSSSGDSGSSGASSSGGSGESSNASGPVTVDYWGWATGYPDAVKAFNDSHKDIQINYEEISPGTKGGYDKILTAVKANNAPCLAQVGYETFTSFVAAGALEDVTQYLESSKSEFPDWVWNQVGVEGKLMGVPVDTGPMGIFYRKDLFEQYGITVPKTWDEFAATAKKVATEHPGVTLVNLPSDPYNYSGFPWQAGAKWFGTADDAWSVSLNSAENKKVADYWQGLVDAKAVATLPSWDAALNTAWNTGQVLSEVGAVWTGGVLKSAAPDTSGKWAVAPMPTWAGSDAVGNVGGSSTAVLKGCKNPKEAAEAALAFSTDPTVVDTLIEKTGIYPASNAGLTSAKLKDGDPFFGGQVIFDTFAEAATKVNTDWQWGPVMTATATAVGDGLGAVQAGSDKMSTMLDKAQATTVAEIKKQGFAVKE